MKFWYRKIEQSIMEQVIQIRCARYVLNKRKYDNITK